MGSSGGGMPFAAGEAVGPNAMSATEWNTIPGVSGGEAPSGGGIDWTSAFAAASKRSGGGINQLGIPGAHGGSTSGLTNVPSLDFSKVLAILFQVIGSATKKGGK